MSNENNNSTVGCVTLVFIITLFLGAAMAFSPDLHELKLKLQHFLGWLLAVSWGNWLILLFILKNDEKLQILNAGLFAMNILMSIGYLIG